MTQLTDQLYYTTSSNDSSFMPYKVIKWHRVPMIAPEIIVYGWAMNVNNSKAERLWKQ